VSPSRRDRRAAAARQAAEPQPVQPKAPGEERLAALDDELHPDPEPEPAAAPVLEVFYGAADPDLGQIGPGGTGSLNGIPDCPVCFAQGGGGHGAGCPNVGKDPDSWVTEPPDGWTRPQVRASYG
jgi:hypothetical protein